MAECIVLVFGGCPLPKEHCIRLASRFPHRVYAAFARLLWPLVLDSAAHWRVQELDKGQRSSFSTVLFLGLTFLSEFAKINLAYRGPRVGLCVHHPHLYFLSNCIPSSDVRVFKECLLELHEN